jgi:hypothetical protein
MMFRRAWLPGWLALASVALIACSGDDDGGGGGEGGGNGIAAVSGDAAVFDNTELVGDAGVLLDGAAPAPVSRLPGGDTVAFDACMIVEVRKVDLLFVVDDSASMGEEQEALRREFPALIRALTSGDRDGDGTVDFPPVQDLHLGVVSTDMGLQGIDGILGCGGLGKDGVLQSAGDTELAGCEESYPSFLSYDAETDSPTQVASDFGCIASLGTEGCGFEQPLEAALKALTPSDSSTGFVSSAGFPDADRGHGDTDNDGFLRPNDPEGPSVLGVVVVTDEEDCSWSDPRHLTPPDFLPPDSELAMQDLNLRCFYNPDNLFPVDRYVDGLRKLREGNEELLVFGVIAGVPPDLVDAEARAGVDFADGAAREEYYDGILGDDRMQETVDATLEAPFGNLEPSCVTDNGRAYPPRRLVQVARGFGEGGIVQSICQDDFGPAMDVLVGSLAARVEDLCMIE